MWCAHVRRRKKGSRDDSRAHGGVDRKAKDDSIDLLSRPGASQRRSLPWPFGLPGHILRYLHDYLSYPMEVEPRRQAPTYTRKDGEGVIAFMLLPHRPDKSIDAAKRSDSHRRKSDNGNGNSPELT